jgi:hypothetical protein
MTRTKESLPFALGNAIMQVWNAGALRGPKGITGQHCFSSSGAKKASFSWSLRRTRILTITSHAVQCNEVQQALGIAKIVDDIVATWNGTLKWQSDLVQTTMRHTSAK